MPPTTRQTVVSADQIGRIDLVVQALTGLTRRQVASLFDHGCIYLNDAPCNQTFQRVAPGDRVSVRFEEHRRYREKPRPWKSSYFRIVHEDAHVLVVDKAAWTLTEPTGDHPEGTLLDAVRKYLQRNGRREQPHLVHRLDRGVSGLLVLAKSADLAEKLKVQFAAHKPLREYVGLVVGEIADKEGSFKSYLATGDNLDRYSTNNPAKGELAVTHYKVEHVLPSRRQSPDPSTAQPASISPASRTTAGPKSHISKRKAVDQQAFAKGEGLPGITAVRVWLETGRRNQIRVHFAEAGHPVLGDPRYQSRLARHPRWKAKRLALHAATLTFEHPVSGKLMKFEAPLPREFLPFMRPPADRSKQAPR